MQPPYKSTVILLNALHFSEENADFCGTCWTAGAEGAWGRLMDVFEQDYRGHYNAHRTYKGKDAQSAPSGFAGQKVDKAEGEKRGPEKGAAGSQSNQSHLKDIWTRMIAVRGARLSRHARIHKDCR